MTDKKRQKVTDIVNIIRLISWAWRALRNKNATRESK